MIASPAEGSTDNDLPATKVAERRPVAQPYRIAVAGVVACAILSTLAVNRFGPDAGSDAIIMTVMAIQRPLLFYWGQNRFATFVPMLLSPVENQYANLLALMWIHGLAFFLFLFTVSQVVVRHLGRNTPADAAIAFAVFVAVAVLVLRPFDFGEFSTGPQPYGLSFAFLAWAVLAFFSLTLTRRLSIPLAALLLAVATGFNQSVILPAVAVSLVAAILGYRSRAALFVAMAVAIFAAWTIVASAYPSPDVSYFDMNWGENLAHLPQSLLQLRTGLNLIPTIALISIALVLWIQKPDAMGWRASVAVAAVFAFAIGWWLLFTLSTWVQLNDFGARYFSATYFALIIAAATVLTSRAVRLQRSVKLIGALVAAGGAVWALAATPKPFAEYKAFAAVGAQVEFARANKVKYIGGDYWQAWPAVFLLLDRADAAFGLADRGEANHEQLVASIVADRSADVDVRALCLAETADRCLATSARVSGMTWRLTEEKCPGACLVIALVET